MRKKQPFFVIIFKTRKNVKKRGQNGSRLGRFDHFWLDIDKDSVQRQWGRAKPRAPLLLDGF